MLADCGEETITKQQVALARCVGTMKPSVLREKYMVLLQEDWCPLIDVLVLYHDACLGQTSIDAETPSVWATIISFSVVK